MYREALNAAVHGVTKSQTQQTKQQQRTVWSPQCFCYPPTPHTQPWTSDLVGPDVGAGTMEIGRTVDYFLTFIT